MTLEQVIGAIRETEAAGGNTVRLHTGDPSIYGAIREQMDRLDTLGIRYDVTPGVSSFCAAAAALSAEYTLPGISQTVILTRMEGRTPVPERERLADLARHESSMAIFLSVHMIDEVAKRLMNHYRPDTPIAVVQRATWPDQKIVLGTLSDIAEKVKAADITKTAQILVGDFLGDEYSLSKLYDPGFSHEFRKASK
jgi:precorrin-4/cobalt-precorrin-4 C11-methyltransferase